MNVNKFMKNDSHYLSYGYFPSYRVFLLILTLEHDTFIYKFRDDLPMYIKCGIKQYYNMDVCKNQLLMKT